MTRPKKPTEEQKARRRAEWRAYYYRHPDRSKARRDKSRKSNTDFVDSFKDKCCRCGDTDKRVLDFHHHRNVKKEREVAALRRAGWSKKKIEAEIKKCTVLCANCHRILHWEERHASMQPGRDRPDKVVREL